jgi:agmatinase
MRLRRVDTSRFDADGAGDADAGVFGLPYDADQSTIVLVPVPWEATTSYGRGTADGPAAIVAASAQLDLFDPALAPMGLSRPWAFGIHCEPENPDVRQWNEEASRHAVPIISMGGRIGSDPAARAALHRVNALSRQLDAWVAGRVHALRAAGHLTGVIGGDHAVALGSIEACAEAEPGLGILHVDAHADLREAYEGFERSHASVMHNVLERCPGVAQIVQVGIRDLSQGEAARAEADPRIRTFYDAAVRRKLHDGASWSGVCDEIIGALPDRVYVSLDIDGLDPTLCPGTGTPVPGGLDFGQIDTLLLRLTEFGRRVVGFDLVEVAPRPGNDWDGNVGARLLYRLCAVALHAQGARDA